MKTHRLGDYGDDIGLLQRRLSSAGYGVAITHLYDDATVEVVGRFQRAMGLVDDGVAGPKTLGALATGRKAPKHLSGADLIAAAQKLGVPVEAVRAVNEVESRGNGYLPDGRPVILFERHVFWTQLGGHGIDPAPLAARYPNVLSETRGGYSGGAGEYTRLASAELIDGAAARESASWGLFQIMGYHWKNLGYSGIDEFVSRMETSETDQLDAFVRFVSADSNLLSALKGRKWAQFAKGYNGKNYAVNLYDVKLAQAYTKYAALIKEAA
jgi:hypothetical protein